MARTQTGFEALEKLAGELDIGFISGALQPPDHGQLFLGQQSLADIILPAWPSGEVAIVIAAGGPPHEQVSIGTAVLDADGLARLEAAAHTVGGHVYRGQLAQLTPASWLQRYGQASAGSQVKQAPSTNARGWNDNMANAEIASLDTSDLVAAARAAGWPANFADEPVLFLNDQPLYRLLMRENAGRNVILVIGGLPESDR